MAGGDEAIRLHFGGCIAQNAHRPRRAPFMLDPALNTGYTASLAWHYTGSSGFIQGRNVALVLARFPASTPHITRTASLLSAAGNMLQDFLP